MNMKTALNAGAPKKGVTSHFWYIENKIGATV